MAAKVIGVDRGTSYFCVAVMEGRQAKVIENPEGAHDAVDGRVRQGRKGSGGSALGHSS